MNAPPDAGISPIHTTADTLWWSLLRGRLLAALAAALSLWAIWSPTRAIVLHVLAEGPTPEHIGAVLAQATVVVDASHALVIAAASLVAVIAAGASKVRSRRSRRRLHS